MSSWAFVLGDSVLEDFVLGAFVLHSCQLQGVSLLSHCGKVMTTVIPQRIRQRTDKIPSEAQAGFRVGCSTIDRLFTPRRLAETYSEFNKHL